MPIDDNDDERNECFFCTEKKELREVPDSIFIAWLIKITGKTKQDYINHLVTEGIIN